MSETETSEAPVALVTGAGNGIGAALCAKLAAAGHRVVVVDIDPEATAKSAESCGGAVFPADVSDLDQNRAMVAHAIERFGRLDIAVLNAGVSSDQPPDLPLDVERYRRVLGVNVDGLAFGIDATVPELARHAGRILVTASLAGLGPDQANPLYALTKSAAIGYVRAIADSLEQRDIRINALCPGFTDTAILGITRRLIRKQGFPLLSPDDVADAALTVLAEPGTGQAWTVVAGRAPQPFAFPPLPTTLMPDGSQARFRPLFSRSAKKEDTP
ncbi:NAD(P)-dependent dehydrogenase (short-subunit alcohol dehydrogenase family) [Catenulispora sp. EB89]|uniref:SDR family NAD(P)-dependent oxidoreductase n=1 Tax=Catenulispora sp. EB89 TaxID=3156257 RepID=UPI003512B61C